MKNGFIIEIKKVMTFSGQLSTSKLKQNQWNKIFFLHLAGFERNSSLKKKTAKTKTNCYCIMMLCNWLV